jgi:hypothetical protein
MIFTSLPRILKIIVTLGWIALSPAGCGDPCRDCLKIECPLSVVDCSRIDKAQCEAKMKEAMMECDEHRQLCFNSCAPAIL